VTLPPSDSWNVRGIDGPAYKVGARCCNPNCQRYSEHAHHMWRRSRIAGDWAWVSVDGYVVANKVGVCVRCHDDLTGRVGGHKAAIQFHSEDKTFHWCLVADTATGVNLHGVGLLEPQPLTPELLATLEPDQGTGSEGHCPFCGAVKQRRRRGAGARLGRRRKTWLVSVPDSVEEDGAEVLDSLVENLAPLIPMPNATASEGRYWVLVPALAFAQMQPDQFVKTWEGR